MPKHKHYLYSTWRNMRGRCNSPTHQKYEHYGARGITICSRWDDFWLFVEDMGERPFGFSLDRINNNGNYEPNNCRWTSYRCQNINRRLPQFTNITHTCQGYRVQIVIERDGKSHQKRFTKLDDAIKHRDICVFERDFLKKFI